MKKLYLLICLLLAFIVGGQNSLRSQNQLNSFRIVGYVPNWINMPTFCATYDFSKLTHIKFAFIIPDTTGNLYQLRIHLALHF